jgi:hypothetical protein
MGQALIRISTLALLLMLAGCTRAKKPEQPPATSEKTAASAVSQIANPEPGSPPPVPPPPGASGNTAVPPPTQSAPNDSPPGIAQINSALEQWVFQHNNPPRDLNELVKQGYLKQTPVPPRGKKFAIDPRTMRALLVE